MPAIMSAAAVAVIPARHAATRFPGKPLVPIAGVPMLRRVYEGACRAKRVNAVLVATDDERIASACAAFGAEVALTSPDHATGTDRIAEAVQGRSEPIVVNVQGDEPLIEGFVIDAAVEALEADPGAPMSTVAHLADEAALADPNRVKLVRDRRGRALYFSRAPIPHRRDAVSFRAPILQHVGLYAYRREFLLELVRLPRTPLEESEALEQLRALEHGASIQVALVDGWHSVPVDVPADVARVEARLRELGRC
jgi:3-deoxy-manno-octulosonate cytidylyltransferase (CMP-KDO synthetase)